MMLVREIATKERFSPVVELRQYTLHPGKRDTLIEVFDRHLVESQEETGMKIIGQFRDLDRPDHFVWMRGFEGMEARRQSLDAFYNGPMWAKHKDMANATMIDSDDVLLLKPAWPGAGFDLAGASRPPAGDKAVDSRSERIFVTAIHHLLPGKEHEFAALYRREAMSLAAGRPIAAFISEHAENTFPRLPVRANENVFVVLGAFETVEEHVASKARLAASPGWRAFAADAGKFEARPAETFRLMPTSRSLLPV
jgi:quinol monooxygenase YgiN